MKKRKRTAATIGYYVYRTICQLWWKQYCNVSAMNSEGTKPHNFHDSSITKNWNGHGEIYSKYICKPLTFFFMSTFPYGCNVHVLVVHFVVVLNCSTQFELRMPVVSKTWQFKFQFLLKMASKCSERPILRVSDQNGVSLLYIMLEIHHSGREPSICGLPHL